MEDAQKAARTNSVWPSVDTGPVANVAGGAEFIITFGHRLSEVTISNGNDGGRIAVEAKFEPVGGTVSKAETMH